MSTSHLNVLELLGKQVSFTYFYPAPVGQLVKKGIVTSVVINLSSSSEICLDYKGDFYLLSELTEFKILGSDPVADAFEALITDNKDFIDSLSKPTL